MEKVNLPIYRAFSETFDKYILGVPYFSDGKYYMLVDDCNKNEDIGTGSFPIDETTLAIHFPDMLDSQGNKIFASLSEDGKGVDIITHPDYDDNKYVVIYDKDRFEFGIQLIEADEEGCWEYSPLQEEELELFEKIGIQK